MKIKIWGVRGSIPSPLTTPEIEDKIRQAILGLPNIDPHDEQAVEEYIATLPQTLRGTAGGNTPCVEVRSGNDLIVLDAGSGFHDLGQELLTSAFSRGEGELHLLISHLHWDHIQGFPMFMPAFVPGNRITIYGCHKDLRTAFELQQRAPMWPKSLADMPAEITFVQLTPGESITIGQVCIHSLLNNHPNQSYSYRLEDGHSVLVYATDAEYKQLDMATLMPYARFFHNADVLIFDAQYTLREAWQRVDWGHSSAMIGVDLARMAGVKKLLLFHYDPTYSDAEIEQIQATAIAYQEQDTTRPICDVVIAYEGMEIELAAPGAVDVQFPVGSEAAVLTPTSVFDEQGVGQLADQLARLAELDGQAISIIDMSQVETLTTAGLKSLVSLCRKRDGTPVVLAAPSENVQKVIELGGHADYFAIYSSVEAALAAVQAREALNLPGQIIKDRYQIQSKIGEGYLGAVLKATDMRQGQTVALKVFSLNFSEERLARLGEQVRRAIHLDHPGVVRILDWDNQELPLQVEEFIDAPSLADLFKTSTHVPVQQAIAIAQQILATLEYVHSWDIVHGDLEPCNIFLTKEGIKISGWGMGILREGRPALPNAHQAPEQAAGRPTTPQADLYAVGVILYRLLTGHYPYEEANIGETNTLPRQLLPPGEWNPNLSPALAHLVMKLLAWQPAERYTSAGEVRSILAALAMEDTDALIRRSTNLVGRESFIETLRSSWEQSRQGAGQVVFITGKLGVGKTALALDATSTFQSAIRLVGYCDPTKTHTPYYLVTQIMEAYLATLSVDRLQKAVEKLSDLAILLPTVHAWVSKSTHKQNALQRSVSLKPRQGQRRVLNQLMEFIQEATQEMPWAVILDDLHWADSNSLSLLCHLSQHLDSLPMLIVGTFEEERLHTRHPLQEIWRGTSCRYTHHLHLENLSRQEAQQVLENLLRSPVPASLLTKLYQHTCGNPLYLEEIALGMMDDGLITMEEGEYHFPDTVDVRLPQDVREAIWRRIRRLSPDAQTMLRSASVLGLTFRLDDLSRIGDLSEYETLEHLDMALGHRQIYELPGGTAFRFSHPEIQYVLYADLGSPRRQLLHRQAGETIEQRCRHEPQFYAEELARHFIEAGNMERALTYSIHAARRSEAIYASDKALFWYNRTLEMLDHLGLEKATQFESLRLLAHESLGNVLAQDGQYDAALEHYTSALFKWLGQEPTSGKAPPSIEAVRIYLFGAELYARQGKYDEAVTWCQKSLDLASRIHDDEAMQARGYACHMLSKICIHTGDLPYAIQFGEESARIYRQIEHPVGQANAYSDLGLAYYHQGKWHQAEEIYRKGLRLRQEVGDTEGEIELRNRIARIHIERGNWESALELLESNLSLGRLVDAPAQIGLTFSLLAHMHVLFGELESANESLAQSEQYFIQSEADKYLSELEQRWGEYYLTIGDLTRALQHTQRSMELAVDQELPLEESQACRLLGRVHIARQEIEPAGTALRQSLELLERMGSRYELARSQVALAYLALAGGAEAEEVEKIREDLHKAIRVLEELDAKPALEEAQVIVRELAES